eukprot:4781683-Prymnesium_polylepis.2
MRQTTDESVPRTTAVARHHIPTLRRCTAACLDVVPCQQQIPASVVDMTHRNGEQYQRVSPRSARTAAARRRRCSHAHCSCASSGFMRTSLAGSWKAAAACAAAGAGVAGDVVH